ncbi:MAG: 23S rRNA (guanosine(2251)-2'-O)-methyltransferase RlmB [Candidatus Limnocylindria bacterium]
MSEWIGGRRPVIEALRAGREAHRLLLAANARPSPELKEVEAEARRAGVSVERTSPERLARLAGFEGHQGVLLEVGERRWADVTEILARAEANRSPAFVLVLEHLQDPTNFGTLLRSAEAAGVDGVIFPARGAAPLSAAAVKASAGASEHLLLARLPTIGEAIHELKQGGLWIAAADQAAPASAWETDLSGPLAVVVGSEGSGLSGATRRRCDLLVSFPMAGRVASLNAATAGALLLFEIVRQRTPGSSGLAPERGIRGSGNASSARGADGDGGREQQASEDA